MYDDIIYIDMKRAVLCNTTPEYIPLKVGITSLSVGITRRCK